MALICSRRESRDDVLTRRSSSRRRSRNSKSRPFKTSYKSLKSSNRSMKRPKRKLRPMSKLESSSAASLIVDRLSWIKMTILILILNSLVKATSLRTPSSNMQSQLKKSQMGLTSDRFVLIFL